MTVAQFYQWLESTRLAEIVGQTAWGFPAVAAVHLLALGLSVGTILWWDLRLLGLAFTACPVSDIYRRVAPWAFVGFGLMFLSGFALFAVRATDVAANAAFQIKVVALLVAGVNAAVFHLITARRMREWDAASVLPWSVRAAGAISMVAWAVVMGAGRVIPYTMF